MRMLCKFWKLLVSVLVLICTSCSLRYTDTSSGQTRIPEFTFNAALFKRYEDNDVSFELESSCIEQYPSDDITYAANADFKSHDAKQDLSGTCKLLGIQAEGDILYFLDDTIIQNQSDNLGIETKSLKWNTVTAQIVSDCNVFTTVQNNGMEVSGTGFSADSTTNEYKFTSMVNGKIETESFPEGNHE